MRRMIRNMLFHISVVLLIIGCGKYEDSIENPSPNNILVEEIGRAHV